MAVGENMTLDEKVEKIKEKLRDESIEMMAQFDVKEAEEDDIPNYKAYLNGTVKDRWERFPCPDVVWGSLTSWQKLCCYKISGSVGVDCDAALRSTVIYQLAFGGGEIISQRKPYCLQRDGFILRGDTMNSYATTVREYIREIWLPEHKSEMIKEGIIVKKRKGKGWEASDNYWNVGKKNWWDAAILDNYSYFENTLPAAAEEFFRLCHTVGNFIPVPPKFQSRGDMTLPSRDYWDLALMCIYHYYYSDVKDTELDMYQLSWMLPSKEDSVPKCQQWLDSFGQGRDGWDSFVERNFLQDFVNQDKEHYGSPKELWKGHFANGAMPRKETDYEQFFTNASAWITARGERIALAVKKALDAEKSETRR